MNALNRYILGQLATGMIMVTAALCCIIWLSQSLRFVEMIVNQGLDASMFLYLTSLLLPNFIGLVLPFALFIVSVFVYSRLNTDREMAVMRACGMSNWGIARPVLILTAVTFALSLLLNMFLMPKSNEIFRDLRWEIRHSFAHIALREGTFNVFNDDTTIYVRERTADGQLLGILVHDTTNPQAASTHMAERGALVKAEDGARVIMFNGSRQVIDQETGKLSILYFDRYTHEINVRSSGSEVRAPEPQEQMLSELFSPHEDPYIAEHDYGRHIVEGHNRIAGPVMIISFAMIAMAALVSGQFSRRGQAKRILIASLAIILVQAGGLGMGSLAASNLTFAPLVYANVTLPILICALMLGFDKLPRVKRSREEAQA